MRLCEWVITATALALLTGLTVSTGMARLTGLAVFDWVGVCCLGWRSDLVYALGWVGVLAGRASFGRADLFCVS